MSLMFPVVKLPQEYVLMLKDSRVSSQHDCSGVVLRYYKRNPGMIKRLESIFSDYDRAKRLPHIITTLGFRSFRDRLASVYLYYQLHKGFPPKTNLELVEDITEFEAQYLSHTTKSSQRLFLLAFYLNMAQITSEAKFMGLSGLPRELKSLLNKGAGRTLQIDWLIITLWHLIHFYGEVKAELVIEQSGGRYQNLLRQLTQEQKICLNQNFLSYGCSVYEYDIFTQEHLA